MRVNKSELLSLSLIHIVAGISQARFKQKVIPGDVLTLELEIIKQKGPVGVGRGTAKVDGKLAASAELTFAIGDGK